MENFTLVAAVAALFTLAAAAAVAAVVAAILALRGRRVVEVVETTAALTTAPTPTKEWGEFDLYQQVELDGRALDALLAGTDWREMWGLEDPTDWEVTL